MEKAIFTALLGVVLTMGILTGCGGPSSSGESNTRTEASRQFLGPGGQNKQAEFGVEGSRAQLAETGKVVAKSLSSRAAYEWSGQCATLSKAAKERVLSAFKAEKTCAGKLAKAAKSASPGILEDNLEGTVVAFRVKGKTGFALYQGNDGKDWAMPMEKEDGEWRVGSLVAEELAEEPSGSSTASKAARSPKSETRP